MESMSKPLSAGVLVVAGLLATLAVTDRSEAFPNIRNDFFAAYPSAVGSRLDSVPSNAGHCGVCHYNFQGGGDRNFYGQAVEALPNRTPAEILSIGSDDSDGDGVSNDDEILVSAAYTNTPTFPGLLPDNIGLVSGVDLVDIEDFLVPVSAIPAASDWGLIVFALLTLTAGTIVWRRATVAA
jgi:hypothetical protein